MSPEKVAQDKIGFITQTAGVTVVDLAAKQRTQATMTGAAANLHDQNMIMRGEIRKEALESIGRERKKAALIKGLRYRVGGVQQKKGDSKQKKACPDHPDELFDVTPCDVEPDDFFPDHFVDEPF